MIWFGKVLCKFFFLSTDCMDVHLLIVGFEILSNLTVNSVHTYILPLHRLIVTQQLIELVRCSRKTFEWCFKIICISNTVSEISFVCLSHLKLKHRVTFYSVSFINCFIHFHMLRPNLMRGLKNHSDIHTYRKLYSFKWTRLFGVEFCLDKRDSESNQLIMIDRFSFFKNYIFLLCIDVETSVIFDCTGLFQ